MHGLTITLWLRISSSFSGLQHIRWVHNVNCNTVKVRWLVKLLPWQDNLLLRFELTVVVECLEVDVFGWWEVEGFVSEVEMALVEGHEGGRGEKSRLDV